MVPQTANAPPPDLPRRLGLLDSTSIVIGTMIGSAIFLVPNTIAQNIHSVPMTLAMWLLAGVMSMFGALAYAELGAMMPASGGQYVYLREAWGPLWGFLCGWAFFLVARSGATAAIAAGFATYFSQFVPMSPAASRGLAAALILALTLVNYRGVRLGAAVQNAFTSLKLLGLLLLIGSTIPGSEHALSQQAAQPSDLSAAQFGAAMVACIFSYNGWLAIGLVGGEIKDPQRNLPRAIILGVTVVTLVYLLTNIGYLRTLTIAEIASTDRVAAATATRTMGTIGSTIVALTILVSTFGAANSTVMTGPRLYFAQARDGLFFGPFGKVHPAFETPHISLVGSGIWSAILALTGSYSQLVSYATFMFWILYGVTVAGLIVLRRTCPDAPRPYRMFGYPITPVLFIGTAGGVAIFGFISAPLTSTIGLLILAAGVPAYYFWRWWANARTGAR
jgi:APA family basic amino acid/polyamine antiporter